MSGENKGASGTPPESSGQGTEGQENPGGNSETVAYDTFAKVLGEKKAMKDKFDSLEAELNKMKQDKLEAEGNKDELINTLRKELSETKTKLSGAVQNFAGAQFQSVVNEEANKMGCSSLELLNAITKEKMKTFEFGEDFKPDRDQVKSMLQDIQKEHGVLFSKEVPKVKEGVPKVNTSSGKKKPSEMTKDEIMAALTAT